MALVNDIAAAAYIFRDEDGKERTITLYTDVPAVPGDYPNLVTFFDAIGDIISNNITVCNLIGYDLTIIKKEDAFTVSAVAESEMVALFDILSADSGEPTVRFTIPCYNTLGAGNDGLIDTAQADISALLDMLIDGDGTVAPCDARNIDLIGSAGTTGSYQVERAVKYHNRSQLGQATVGG
jgi:hypothetical protein